MGFIPKWEQVWMLETSDVAQAVKVEVLVGGDMPDFRIKSIGFGDLDPIEKMALVRNSVACAMRHMRSQIRTREVREDPKKAEVQVALDSEIKALQEELAREKEAHLKTMGLVESLKAELAKAEKDKTGLAKAKTDLIDKWDQARDALGELRVEFGKLTAISDRDNETLNKMGTQLARADAEVQRLKSEQKEKEILAARVAELKGQVESLKAHGGVEAALNAERKEIMREILAYKEDLPMESQEQTADSCAQLVLNRIT